MNTKQTKGFTLIELLIVIGIIAILATVVILTLNPAELLRQARDSTRTSDLATIKSAIALYQADVSSPNLGTSTASGWCYISVSTGGVMPTSTDGNQCGGRFETSASSTTSISIINVVSETNKRLANGSGWIPVDLTKISSGAPISALPVDPVAPNGAGAIVAGDFYASSTLADDRYYAYATDGVNGFEINGVLESKKFANSSVNDGGDNDTLYEAGTKPGLNL